MIVDPKDIQLGGAAFPELSSASWKKNKGLVAKMKGETGLTKSLGVLETEYAALKTLLASKPNFPAETFVPGMAEKTWRGNSDVAASHLVAAAKKVSDAADEVAKDAGTTAAEYKKSSAIPKKTREYVESMEKSAIAYGKQIKGMLSQRTIDAYLDQQEVVARQNIADFLRHVHAQSWTIMISAAGKIDKFNAVKWDVLSKAKPEDASKLWNNGVHQPLRAIFAALLKMPEDADAAKLVKDHKGLNRGNAMDFTVIAKDDLQDTYADAHAFSGVLQKVAARHI